MKKAMVVVGAAMAACVSFGETFTYDWDGTTTSYGDGKVTVTYAESGEVATLNSNIPEGDTVVFTGDAIAFANDALVTRLGLGCLVFSNNVAAVGNLIFTGPSSWTFAYPAEEPLSTLHAGRTAPYLAFPGLRNLEDYQLKDTTAHSILYSITANPKAEQSMAPYFQERKGGVISAQLQGWNGNVTRAIGVDLWQTDEGVVVSNKWAKNGPSSQNIVGQDFTTVSDKGDRDFIPGRLVLFPVQSDSMREVSLAGGLEVGGMLLVSNAVSVVLQKAAVRDCFEIPVRLGTKGRLVFRDCGTFTNAAQAYGSDGEICYESSDAPAPAEGETIEWNGELGTDPMVMLANADLSSITGVTAKIRWKAYNSDSWVTASAKFRGDLPAIAYRDYALYSGCRFQSDRGNNQLSTAAVLHFEQDGANVTAKKKQGYYSWSSHQYGADDPTTWDPFNDKSKLANPKTLYSGTYAASKYNVTNLKFHLSRPLGNRITDYVTLVGTDQTDTVVYRFRPGENRELVARLAAIKAVPYESGEIHVHDRARVLLYGKESISDYNWSRGMGHSQKPAKHFVYPGGQILTLKQKHNAVYQTINIAGGSYLFNDSGNNIYNNTRGYTFTDYLGHVVYSDGGRSVGDTPYLGQVSYTSIIPSITVTGTEPCFSDNGWNICQSYTDATPGTFQLKVADVTGNADVDFTIGGAVKNAGGSAMTLVKSGAGTVLFTAENQMNAAYPIEINEGTVMFGRSGCFNADQTYALNGGSLAFAANTTNVLASVSLSETSGLVLADGASVTIGDCSAQTWAAGTRVNIVGDEKKCSIRFGESAAALTAAQVRQLRWNGKRCMLDEDGNLVSYVPGMVFLVR